MKNVKVPLKCKFCDVFMKVTSTLTAFLQLSLLAGSVAGSAAASRPLYQHRQDPYIASSVWGIMLSYCE